MKAKLVVPAVAFVMTSAAALIATEAIATDIPKEGTIAGKITETGTLLQSTPIGKNGDLLNVFEENGALEDSGGTHKLHCVWFAPVIKATVVEPHGYCLATDRDGDQMLIRATSGTRPFSASTGHTGGEVIMGTGKYTWMMSSFASTCQVGPGKDPSQYTVACDTQQNYKMP